MAETVCSAVASEAARKFSLFLSGEDGDSESPQDKVERFELALIKLQTILAMSEDWEIAHRPLLHWKAKIKRASNEGKALLRAHKKQLKRRNTSQSIRIRMAQLAKRFIPFSYGAEDLINAATVKRFERLADGAGDFLKFVERSGNHKSFMLLNHKSFMLLPSIIRSLCDGKAMEFSLRMGSSTAVVLLQPWWIEENDEGSAEKACLWVSYEHDQALEKNFKMMTIFHLSDFIDITRIAMNCVDLLPPQFCNARVTMKELLAEMAFCGRNSPAPSLLYMRFVRGIQNSHHYGFEMRRHNKCSSDIIQLADPILLVCAHCYILPVEKSSHNPLELVWHSSPNYMPKKLSEQHEMAEPHMVQALIPKVINGFYHEEGDFNHARQWWCPKSSTRLSMTPVLSSPTTLQKWCARQKQDNSTKWCADSKNSIRHGPTQLI